MHWGNRRWRETLRRHYPTMRHALLLITVLLCSACAWRSGNAWPPAATPKGPAVVFVPVAMGPLSAVHPGGASSWADDLAARLDLLSRNADGFAAVALPASDAAVWVAHPPVATPGAALVVLTTVTKIEDTSTTLTKRTTATATMRALDASGQQVWVKTLSADIEGSDAAKVQGPAGRIEVRAGWAAVAACANALADFVVTRPDPTSVPPVVAAAPVVVLPPPAAGLVRLRIDSIPPNADVLIDGRLRGTTPCHVDLPSGSEATIRIERAGFQPWDRTLVPSEALVLTPALAPLAPPAPASVP